MVEIFLENVSHVYGTGTTALQGLDLKIADGSCTALLGPSGCGKTTTMNIIAGLLHPSKGRVFFDGEDVTRMTPQKRNVAMVFQFPIIYDKTVFENIAFPLRCSKKPRDEIRKKVREIAERVGLNEFLNLPANKLDAGARQRVALARAFVREPNVFLLDEPLTNVDPESRLEMKSKIKEMQRLLDQTMIYVTHDQGEALTLAERIAVMRDGKILQYDTPESLYEYPQNKFVAWFIGNPGMDLFDCTVEESGNKSEFDLGEVKIATSGFQLSRIPKEIVLGIRPEHVQVSTSEKAGWIRARCQLMEKLGNLSLLHLMKGNMSINAKTTVTDVKEGQDLWVNFPSGKIRLYDRSGELVSYQSVGDKS